jgi:hypothetical protein
MKSSGMTLQQIADAFEQEGRPTPSGRGHWQAVTVMRVLKQPIGLNLDPEFTKAVVNDNDFPSLPLFESESKVHT